MKKQRGYYEVKGDGQIIGTTRSKKEAGRIMNDYEKQKIAKEWAGLFAGIIIAGGIMLLFWACS